MQHFFAKQSGVFALLLVYYVARFVGMFVNNTCNNRLAAKCAIRVFV